MKSSRSSQSKGKSAAKKTTAKSAPKKASNGRSSSNGTASKSRSTTTASKSKSSSSTSRGSRSTSSKSTASKASSSRSKAKATPREGLTKVLQDGLKDIYYAEKQLYKALNKVAKASTNEELRTAFETHREETGQQIERLEEVFELMEMRAQGKKCPAMDGLIEEASEHIEEMDKGPALDAALIVGAQKVEHYEMAAYGSMRTFANDLGYTEAAAIFQEILDQEAATDEKLTQIAQTVNQEALAEEGAEGGNMSKVTASADGEDMEDEEA